MSQVAASEDVEPTHSPSDDSYQTTTRSNRYNLRPLKVPHYFSQSDGDSDILDTTATMADQGELMNMFTKLMEDQTTKMAKQQEFMTRLVLSQQQEEQQAAQRERVRQEERSDRLEQERRARDKEREELRSKEKLTQMVIDKIPPMKEGGDVQLFIQGLENDLTQENIPRNIWKVLLTTRLTPALKEHIWDLQQDPVATFDDIKFRLLERTGQSLVSVGQQLFVSLGKELRKMSAPSATQLVFRLLERFFHKADTKLEIINRTAIALLRAHMSSQGQLFLDGRTVTSRKDLQEALQSWETIHGAPFGVEGQLPKKQEYRVTTFNCFKCGKPGHKAWDCRSAPNGETLKKETSQPLFTCFLCGAPGHKSMDCPKKTGNKDLETPKKEVKVNTVRQADQPNTVEGMVNGNLVRILLDTGASISVVPDSHVTIDRLKQERVTVTDANGGKVSRQVALVDIRIGDIYMSRLAAVAPSESLDGIVLLALDVSNDSDFGILKFSRNQRNHEHAMAVNTRQEVAKQMEEDRVEREVSRKEQVCPRKMVIDRVEESDDAVAVGLASQDGDAISTANETVSGIVVPSEGPFDLNIPCLTNGGDGEQLISQVKEDESLNVCKGLADKGERGYSWENGLLLHRTVDQAHGYIDRIVLPKCRRKMVLQLAHEGAGHLSARKVRAAINRRFTWPLLATDVEKHCKSCYTCQTTSKAGQRAVPMVERPILAEPFEQVAFDLVGPLPNAKGGFRYILTSVCMATRWPDAIPLKSITAKAVADAAMQIFGRTGLPLQILTDQGTQFTGSLMKELTAILGIERIRTTAYHPQTNGTLERLHATLEAMLAKAHTLGLDWAQQVPFALFALRQAPNRDTGFSPFELIYGHHVRTPLDLLYAGWKEDHHRQLGMSAWVEVLGERLEVLRDIAVEKGLCERRKRKEQYDKGKIKRELGAGDRVWCRIPGMTGKLEESWEGPFKVESRLGEVNYRVVEEDGRGRRKVVHINNVKVFRERDESVCALTVIADDQGLGESCVQLKNELCEGYVEEELMSVLAECEDVLRDIPGETGVIQMHIEVDKAAKVISQQPYRIPDRLKEGVKNEIDTLLQSNIIEPSESPWSSPIVPVVKPDGNIRLCVDYRRLNSVTPQVQTYMPTLGDILEKAGQAKVLSKLDLSKGFYQVQLDDSSKDFTTFTSPFGRFRFRRMPFGLKNAPATFQQLMDNVLQDCLSFSSAYIDDLLIFSINWENHLQHIRTVLQTLRKAGLTAKPSKCQWARTHLDYLGHRIGGGKVAVPHHRIAAMAEFKQPVTKKDLRSFLGSVGYYRRFIKGYSSLSYILSPACSDKTPGTVQWTPEMLEAFHRLRVSLCDYCILNVPCVSDHFVLHTDASGTGVGCVLNVVREGQELPVAFFSRQLRGAEHRYSATELEALAVIESVKHFSHFLFGASFVVFTDHKPLCSLFSSKSLNKRLHGMMLKMMEHDMSICYRAGSTNGNADGLSRQAWEKDEYPEADPEGFLMSPNMPHLGMGGCGVHLREEEREGEKKDFV